MAAVGGRADRGGDRTRVVAAGRHAGGHGSNERVDERTDAAGARTAQIAEPRSGATAGGETALDVAPLAYGKLLNRIDLRNGIRVAPAASVG